MTTQPFSSYVREIITFLMYHCTYDQVPKDYKPYVDRHVQSIVEAAVGCTGDLMPRRADASSDKVYSAFHDGRRIGYNQALAVIRAALRGGDDSWEKK